MKIFKDGVESADYKGQRSSGKRQLIGEGGYCGFGTGSRPGESLETTVVGVGLLVSLAVVHCGCFLHVTHQFYFYNIYSCGNCEIVPVLVVVGKLKTCFLSGILLFFQSDIYCMFTGCGIGPSIAIKFS